MIVVKTLKTFNGTVLPIFKNNGKFWVGFSRVGRAIGYRGTIGITTYTNLLVKALQKLKLDAVQMRIEKTSSYFINVENIVALLEKFIELNTEKKCIQPATLASQNEIDFNAKKLLEQFQMLDISKLENAAAE